MKQNNVIDMTAYFLGQQGTAPKKAPNIPGRILHILSRVVETSAAVVTALCICVCTLLFFTML